MPLTPYEHGFIEALFQDNRVAMGLVDREFRYVRVNDALASINGLPAREHVGKTIHEVIPGWGDLMEEMLQGILTSGAPVLMELSGPTPADPNADRHFVASYFPIVNGTEAIGVGALLVERTDIVRAERELMDQAHTIYESVVQDLTVAQLAMDQKDDERAYTAVNRALLAARKVASKVFFGRQSVD